MAQPSTKHIFTRYQVFIIALLSFLQFTIVLDFMVLSPLSPILLTELHITPSQFGMVVSAYAFSAGISGLLAAGFADKFDRKKLLLFFYFGFILGTFLCGIAPSYYFLLGARIVTGIFGGVISSVSFAIITDLFDLKVRGRVMGFVQMAFATSQVMGLPVGLYLANRLGWHSPFLMIVALGTIVGIGVVFYMRPIVEHLKLQTNRSAFSHLISTARQPKYVRAFLVTTLLATGGYMLMPFGAAFGVNNLGMTNDQLPLLYFVTGICSMIAGPLVGRLSDTVGKYTIFVAGSLLAIVIVLIYTNMGITPFWILVGLNVVMFIGISSRMIAASALMTAVPEPSERGAFMGVNASVQSISGGIAAAVAGLIVVQATPEAPLQNYPILGYVVVGSMITTIFMMYGIHLFVKAKPEASLKPLIKEEEPIEKEVA